MSAATAKRLRALRSAATGPRLEGLASPHGAPSLEPGSPAAGCVPRPRLVSRLVEALPQLALVAAPAGYGKTTLLAQWDRADKRPFAWITIDAAHEESGALVADVEQALDDLAPGGLHSRGSTTRSRRSSATVGLARLARSLGGRPPFVLVLDDLQELRSEASLEAVRTLARHVPAGSVLALATRTEPPLSMGRLRANRALTEIRPRDLVMTAREGAALLERCGLALTEGEATAIVHKAEGWPAGLYLAALALSDETDMSAAVERFGGDDTIVAEYLRDELLSDMPEATLSFLRRSSLLERLSGPVCDYVLERSGSAQLLDSIGRGDLLLVPLDRAGEAFRCHGLLGQTLRADLRRVEPDAEARLHCRASDWYAARRDVDRAIHHAVAGHDARRAAVLLAESAPHYVGHGQSAILERWLSSFTPEQIGAEPALALAAANCDLLKGKLDAVQQWESAGGPLLRAVVAAQGVRQMGEDAARAYELQPEGSPWRALCCLLEGVAQHLTGDSDAAQERLEEGVRCGAVGAPNVQTLCLAQLALVASERDDWDGAAGFIGRALAQVEHYALGSYPSSALVFAVSAAVRARRGRVDEAQEDAREGRRLLELLTDFMPWYEVETRTALAAASARLSDSAGARESLAHAARLARRLPEATALHEGIERLERTLEAVAARPALLTTAELRVLGFLPTHLSFREIAARLYVSANTVKTQAHAVYRKLDAASRSEAVAQATRLGLLDCG